MRWIAAAAVLASPARPRARGGVLARDGAQELQERTTGIPPRSWSARWWRRSTSGLAGSLLRVSDNELGPRGERLVVLIDGLDEYDPPAGPLPGDPLAAFLPVCAAA